MHVTFEREVRISTDEKTKKQLDVSLTAMIITLTINTELNYNKDKEINSKFSQLYRIKNLEPVSHFDFLPKLASIFCKFVWGYRPYQQLFNGNSSLIHVSWTIFNQYLTIPLSFP